MLQMVAQMINGGKHIDNPKLIYKKTNKVEILPLDNDQMKVNLDGEYGGDAPMKFTDLQQHIEFVANRSGMSENSVSVAKRKFVEEAEKLDTK